MLITSVPSLQPGNYLQFLNKRPQGMKSQPSVLEFINNLPTHSRWSICRHPNIQCLGLHIPGHNLYLNGLKGMRWELALRTGYPIIALNHCLHLTLKKLVLVKSGDRLKLDQPFPAPIWQSLGP